ncbi:MAG: flagellin [Clostridia bacterium]|nr:flagellin [Clostridia bacterium]
MIINHNIAALNTYRYLTNVNNATQKSLERLSSGLRINRAADDAAGLAISEKMRGQISGLTQAARNAQDAISLIQTAEGGLNESQAILQRMRELAVQAASDTNTPADRAQIQKEIDQLSQELSRIGNTTEFNTMPLLNGNFRGTFQIGANQNQSMTVTIGDMRGYQLGVAGKVAVQQTASLETGATISEGTYTVQKVSDTEYKLINSDGVQVGKSTDGKTWTDMATTPNNQFIFADAVTSGTITIANGKATGTAYIDNMGLQAGTYTVDSSNNVLDSTGKKIGTYDAANKKIVDLSGNDLTGTVNTTLTSTTFTVGGVDVSTQTAANSAITIIQAALDKVSDQRSALGAYQNRLEHTINNLNTAGENLTAAESRIRDVDMAEEMMSFTRNQIIAQAATAMLAQANAQPQLVLQLLR